MKPFDLEKAKNGDPVVTVEGCSVRLLCFDAKGDYPIIGLVRDEDSDCAESWTIKGIYNPDEPGIMDLRMDSKKVKWYCLYKDSGGVLGTTWPGSYPDADNFKAKHPDITILAEHTYEYEED